MKTIAFLLLLASTSLCVGQKKNEEASALAVEGARKLHSTMRDPDSFKIGRVWAMKSGKYGYAICYDFYSRNGFGGMNRATALYAMRTRKKDLELGLYTLTVLDDSEIGQGYSFDARCGDHALKHDASLGDFTDAVQSDQKNSQHLDEAKKASN